MKNFSQLLIALPAFLIFTLSTSAQDTETGLSSNVLIEEVVVTARKKGRISTGCTCCTFGNESRAIRNIKI